MMMGKLSQWLRLVWHVSWPETIGPRFVVGPARLYEIANADDAGLQEWRTWARLPVPRKTPTAGLTWWVHPC